MAKQKDVLPKRIAGVKVPKSLRRGPTGEFLSGVAREFIADGAVAALGAVLASQAKAGSKTRRLAKKGKWAAIRRAHHADDAVATLAYALRQGARAFAETLRQPPPESAAASSQDAPGPAEERGLARSPA